MFEMGGRPDKQFAKPAGSEPVRQEVFCTVTINVPSNGKDNKDQCRDEIYLSNNQSGKQHEPDDKGVVDKCFDVMKNMTGDNRWIDVLVMNTMDIPEAFGMKQSMTPVKVRIV